MRERVIIFIFVLICVAYSVPAKGIVIEPSNIVLPASPGELFSFDLIVRKLPSSFDAVGYQSTLEVSGPGILILNEISSVAVSVEPSYWLYQNSAGAVASAYPGSKYTFGDSPYQGNGTLGAIDSIVARYAFDWDGTLGPYSFTFDFSNLNENYVLGPSPDYELYPLELPQGNWYSYPIVDADISSFTVAIPEPTTFLLLALGGLLLRKKK